MAAGDEAGLVALARRGDSRAFEALVRRHRASVVSLAYRMVGDADVAQDVAQEAFVSAYRRLASFRGDAAFSTWLYRIAVNAAREHLRSRGRRQRRTEKWGRLEAASAGPTADERDAGSTGAGPGADCGTAADAGPVTALLQELPERQRAALALFYLRELTVEEIAATLGAAPGTVKAWLSRGRDRMRRLAEERGLL